MKKTLAALLQTAFVTAFAAVQEPAPTREWVRQYCATTCVAQTAASIAATAVTSSSNGVNTTTFTDGTNTYSLVWEDATVAAVMSSNCNAVAVQSGFTNDMCFVWQEAVTGYVNHALTIYATKTNLFSGAYLSGYADDGTLHMTNGLGGDFTLWSVKLQPTFANTLIGD